nr:DUF6270 domain-containing protein [Terrabacter sp. MAHUQ-38]
MSGVKTGVGGLTFEFSLTCDADDPTDAPLRVITASPSATLRTECPGTLKVAVVDGLGNRLQTLWSRWPIADSGAQRSLAPVVFVYGSCVTRDAFALSGAPPLADYIARSPLGSAFSPPPDAQDLIRLEDNPSAFQRRMVDVDLNKGLATLLESTRFDLLVLDFIDERLSMVRTGSGFVTYSPEAERCGLRPDTADLVSPGSAEHVAAFTSGLDALIAVVPSDRILVNKVYWATTTADGEPLAHADSIRQNNETLDALYTLSADRDLRFLHYPERVFVSDPAHKWGLSPFHYAGTLYDHTLRGIAGAFSDLSVHATASRR